MVINSFAGASSSDAGAPFLDLGLCVSGGRVSTRICDGWGDFDFDVVGFPFLDGDVPRCVSCVVCVFRLIRFAGASSNLDDFGCLNGALTAKLLGRGCRCFRLRKAFSKFYRRHSALLEGCGVGLKTLLQQGISEPEFYGDLVYRFGKIDFLVKSDFSGRFRKLISRYGGVGCGLDVVRRTACLVVGPIVVDGCASLFGCTTAVRASDGGGLFVGLWPVGWGLAVCLWLGTPWFNCWFSFALAYSRISHECSSLFIIVINLIFMFSL